MTETAGLFPAVLVQRIDQRLVGLVDHATFDAQLWREFAALDAEIVLEQRDLLGHLEVREPGRLAATSFSILA